MSKHEKKDPQDKYRGNGHEPGVFPYKDRGGRHEKPDTDDTDDKDQKGGKDTTK
jgi:hypothetical protein